MPRRAALALSLALIVPIGFYFRRYHDSVGGALYEIFWCLFAALVNPRWRPAPIALAVLAATCLLEFLQLWHPPALELIRSHFLGRAILGTYFDWSDFPPYFIGSAIGYVCLRLLPHTRRAA